MRTPSRVRGAWRTLAAGRTVSVRRTLPARATAILCDDAGSSPAEFVMVGVLLTALTLGVLQFGLAVYVRNVVHDAAVEGAYHGALADSSPAEGAERTRAIIARTVGAEFAQSVTAHEANTLGYLTVRIDVEATVPVAGLWGVPRAMHVSADAPKEMLDAR